MRAPKPQSVDISHGLGTAGRRLLVAQRLTTHIQPGTGQTQTFDTRNAAVLKDTDSGEVQRRRDEGLTRLGVGHQEKKELACNRSVAGVGGV